MFEQLILIVHALAAIAMVGLIMIQHGKGADMGASFGSGSSQTVLGVQGGGNLLTHATAVLATVFFVTSLTLGYYAKQQSQTTGDVIIEVPVAEQVLNKSALNDEIPTIVEKPASGEKVPAAKEVSEASNVPAVDSDVPKE